MAESKKANGPFLARFTYTEEILQDFEGIYNRKKKVSPITRVVCGAIGLAGVIYFGLQLYRVGMSVARVGYFIACSLLILVAFAGGGDRGDETISKYRKHYKGRQAEFRIDEDGVYMQLSGQKNHAQSKFSQIYGLCETEKCFYFIIRGKAYYILPKAAVKGGTAEELAAYMQKKCKKSFMSY